MFRWLMRQLGSVSPDPAMVDLVPINNGDATQAPRPAAPGNGLTHEQKLQLAADRLGHAFKCAAEGLPREIARDRENIVRVDDPAQAWAEALIEDAERGLLRSATTAAPLARNVSTLRKPR